MAGNQSVRDRLLGLMGLDPKLADVAELPQPFTRVAITIALYRNR